VWLDTEPGRSAGLLRYLQQMVFWSKVQPRDAISEVAVLTLLGPSTGRLLMDLDGDTDGVVVRAFDGRADLLVPRERLVEVWQRLVSAGATPAGTWAHEALRAAALRARLGVDTDDRTIPHEVGWIGAAVHLDKGCYRGQETVARVANLGRAPRRMVLLHLESGDTLPPTGSQVHTGQGDQTQRVVGRVGTVATHHELGPIALALVKRSVEPPTPLLAGDAAASIDPDSVPPDSGEPPGRAALRRLRA
jgi:folate-binding protein YgfZ